MNRQRGEVSTDRCLEALGNTGFHGGQVLVAVTALECFTDGSGGAADGGAWARSGADCEMDDLVLEVKHECLLALFRVIGQGYVGEPESVGFVDDVGDSAGEKDPDPEGLGPGWQSH